MVFISRGAMRFLPCRRKSFPDHRMSKNVKDLAPESLRENMGNTRARRLSLEVRTVKPGDMQGLAKPATRIEPGEAWISNASLPWCSARHCFARKMTAAN